jgi:hypothetical protein
MLHTSGLPQFAQVAECSKVRLNSASTSSSFCHRADLRSFSQVIEIRDGAEGFTEEIVNAKLLA